MLKIKDSSRKHLIKSGFHFSSVYSDSNENYYVSTFPVLFYKRKPVLECELIVKESTGEIEQNIYTVGTHTVYSPYYTERFQTNNLNVIKIRKKVNSKLNDIGVADTEEKKKKRRNQKKDVS